LLHLWSKGESFFLVVDVKADFSGSYINVSIGGTQEGWHPCIDIHVNNDEIHGYEEIPNSHLNVLRYPCRVADQLIR
jgi:hypothetical protein